jgi:hypothetical protein
MARHTISLLLFICRISFRVWLAALQLTRRQPYRPTATAGAALRGGRRARSVEAFCCLMLRIAALRVHARTAARALAERLRRQSIARKFFATVAGLRAPLARTADRPNLSPWSQDGQCLARRPATITSDAAPAARFGRRPNQADCRRRKHRRRCEPRVRAA